LPDCFKKLVKSIVESHSTNENDNNTDNVCDFRLSPQCT
jgi:hypothetical protein